MVLTGLMSIDPADNVSFTGSRTQSILDQEWTTTISNAKVGRLTDRGLVRMLLNVRICFGTDVRVVS